MDTQDTSTLYAISPNGLRLHVGWDDACKEYAYYITDLIGGLMLDEAPSNHRHESIEPVRAIGLNALRSLEGTHDHNFEGAFVREVAYRKAKDVAGFDKHGVGSKKFFETVSKARAQSDKEALRYCQSLVDATASTLPDMGPTTVNLNHIIEALPEPARKLNTSTPPSTKPTPPTDKPFTFAKTPCGTISAVWLGGEGKVVEVWDSTAPNKVKVVLNTATDHPDPAVSFRDLADMLRRGARVGGGGFNDNPLYAAALSSCDTQQERDFLMWGVFKALAFGEVWAEEVCRGHVAFSKAALGKDAVDYARSPKSIYMGLALVPAAAGFEAGVGLIVDTKNVGTWYGSGMGPALSEGWGKLWAAEVAAKGRTQLTASRRYQDLANRFRSATQLPRELITASGGELAVPVSFKALSMRHVNGDYQHVLEFMEAITTGKPLPAYPVPPGAAPVTAVVQEEVKPEPTPAEWARLYNNLTALKKKAPHLWTPDLAKQLAEAREKRIAPLPGAEWINGKGPLHGKVVGRD